MPLKLTTWNVEHAGRLVGPNPSPAVTERRRRVRETLEAIDPDVVCLVEGPKGEVAISAFCQQVLASGWVPKLLSRPGEALGTRDSAYEMKGTQWVWFLVRSALDGVSQLQPPSTWQAFTLAQSWPVHLWGKPAVSRHSHYRHPQVLIVDLEQGQQLEVIGVHLKSKINQKPIERDAAGNLTGEFLDEALEARIKLATEARNVRSYVAAKFHQVVSPGLVIMGDCNDGPGHDAFETGYLFFDLITNLQGEVLVAERFFNHALFDFPQDLRWTARFADEILDLPASRNPLLLDHILMSQPLCRGELPLIANPGAGRVEHEAYERANAGSRSSTRSSDHRPVTCVLSARV